MDGYLLVLGLAALPAAGTFAGALMSEMLDVSERTLSLALHLAAGIVLAVVRRGLMPEALRGSPAWVPILAFVTGGGFFVLLDRALGVVLARMNLGERPRGLTGSRRPGDPTVT